LPCEFLLSSLLLQQLHLQRYLIEYKLAGNDLPCILPPHLKPPSQRPGRGSIGSELGSVGEDGEGVPKEGGGGGGGGGWHLEDQEPQPPPRKRGGSPGDGSRGESPSS